MIISKIASQNPLAMTTNRNAVRLSLRLEGSNLPLDYGNPHIHSLIQILPVADYMVVR